LFVRPLSYLPLNVLYGLADIFYLILKYIVRYRIHIIETNINNSFSTYTATQKEALIRDYYHFLADLMAENIKGLSISDSEIDRRVKYEGVKILQKYWQEGRNVTIMTGHNCNFEWMLMTINKYLPQTVYSFYVDISNPYFRKLMLNNRTRHGLQLLQAKDASTFYKDGSIQNFANIFAADQSPSNVEKAVWAKFMNQETAFVMGAYKYSLQKNCAVVYMSIKRVQRGYYTIQFTELTASLQSINVHTFLQQYIQALESTIHQEPAYWLWSHRRWKHKRVVKDLNPA
jgi:KDO2-lipid IV(A) lauroyltransferase